MSEEQLNSALNLMRRMPPANTENSLAGLLELLPELTDELLNHIDQPLKLQKDTTTNQHFILCDYNRDGDSFRSPWSNSYFPPLEDGFVPSTSLRALEIEANKLFDIYRKFYFEGGYSSVYFFETEERVSTNFGAVFLIHKDSPQDSLRPTEKNGASNNGTTPSGNEKGWWDSIHVFEVTTEKNGEVLYKLTTTVMVSLAINEGGCGKVNLSGSMTKQDDKRVHLPPQLASAASSTSTFSHALIAAYIENMGKMIEEMELKIRNSIEGIYIQKTREVVNGMRSTNINQRAKWDDVANSLNAALPKRRE